MSKWYKAINLYNITCSAALTFSKEEAEIFNVILQICKKHNEISPTSLYETYGLNKSIAKKLLDLLTNDLNLLVEENINGESLYKLEENISNQKNILKQDQFYYQTNVRFNICLNPLIVSNKRFRLENIEDFTDSDLLIDALEDIDHISKYKRDIMHIYKIPSVYSGFDLSKGIKLNAIAQCRIIQENDNFILDNNNYRFANISVHHPDYKKLKKEIEDTSSNTKQLEECLCGKLSLLIKAVKFSVEFTENYEDLVLNIEEEDMDNIGDLYQVIKRVKNKPISARIEGGWYYNIKLKVKISNKTVRNWIILLNKLKSMIKDNYIDIVNQDRIAVESKIKETITLINIENDYKDFTPNIEDIVEVLKQIANYSNDGWFQMIYAKFFEKEVVI